jgi:quinol monooxygenase YgiN
MSRSRRKPTRLNPKTKELAMAETVTKGLLVRIEAKPGKESDVEDFLNQGKSLVEEESETTAWFAIRFGEATYGIFDVFPDEDGRDAHLGGAVAKALGENAGELYSEPEIEKLDVIASKLPG